MAAALSAQPGRLRSNFALAHELVSFAELDKQSDIAPVSARQYSQAADLCMRMHYYRQALLYKQKAISIDSSHCDSAYVEILRCNGYYKDAATTCYRLGGPLPGNLRFALSYSSANPLIEAGLQHSVTAPGFIYALHCTDTTLQFAATGIPVDPLSISLSTHQLGATPLRFAANHKGGYLGYPDIDMSIENCSYSVDHPSGITYITLQDPAGRSWLYQLRKKNAKKQKIRRVKFEGFAMTVEHPVFTRDGRIMIFASDYEGGYGGYDLWYSVLAGGHWSMPHNLGTNINTSRDELSPSIFNQYLLFASNGHQNNYGGLDIYSTHLMDWNSCSDTVGAISLGHNPVQNLFAPINSPFDDLELSLSPDSSCGYWVSYRDSNTLSGRIYGFDEQWFPSMLQGVVYDNYGTTLPNVKITLMQGVRELYTTHTGYGGNYHLFLRPNTAYTVIFQKDNYFKHSLNVKTDPSSSHDLIATQTSNITLSGYQTNHTYGHLDVFEPNAGVELSQQGRRTLSDFARFARENPHLTIHVTMLCRHTTDKKFNALVNRHRSANLTTYLRNNGVPSSQIKITTISELPPDYHLKLHDNIKNALWIEYK